jgi:hypothetical protein
LFVVKESVLSGGGREWQTSRGALGIWLPGKGVFIVQMQGHGSEEWVAPICDSFDTVLSQTEKVHIFFDLGKMHNYDSRLRTDLTARFLRDRSRISEFDLLAQSRIVAMGVAVANLALSGLLNAFVKRLDFNVALDIALKDAGVVGFTSRSLAA